MANYKRKLPELKYTSWASVLKTAENLKLPIEKWGVGEGKKGLWNRWADLVEICEAIAERKYKEAENKRIIAEWLAVKG